MYAFTQIDNSDKANAHNVPFWQEANMWSHLRQLSRTAEMGPRSRQCRTRLNPNSRFARLTNSAWIPQTIQILREQVSAEKILRNRVEETRCLEEEL